MNCVHDIFLNSFLILCIQLDGSQELHDNDSSLQRYLYQQYDACPETIDGNKGAFIVGKKLISAHKGNMEFQTPPPPPTHTPFRSVGRESVNSYT